MGMVVTSLHVLLVLALQLSPSLSVYTDRPHETELRPHAGSSWGTWGPSEFCPNGSWASGFQLMVEPSCGDICDDTALNSLKLFCSQLTGVEDGFVTSKTGNFGGWNDPLMCGEAGSFISGIQFKSEKETLRAGEVVRHLDETAGNNVNMACSHGSVLAGNGENFGTWSNFEMCPEGQAVCGIRTLVEDPQGVLTDDTALNQIILYCCELYQQEPACESDWECNVGLAGVCASDTTGQMVECGYCEAGQCLPGCRYNSSALEIPRCPEGLPVCNSATH